MIQAGLLCASFAAVFIATVSWLYYAMAIALWLFVFGDDSTTFGWYALAIAIPLALLFTASFVGGMIRWSAGSTVLGWAILAAVILEVLFVIAVKS
jgi:hypothetical protein